MITNLTPVMFLYVKPRHRRNLRRERIARALCVALLTLGPVLFMLAARQ